MTVLIETPSLDLTTAEKEPPAELTGELAWCLRRFVTGRADESALRRAEAALAAWEAWSTGVAVDALG
ncbi:MAG: hypothetical protein QOE80_3405 [Actinomycetota bacterium]|jgi:hypothetical protein|nr:hypothetical protein [Actinomycetota bacterium]